MAVYIIIDGTPVLVPRAVVAAGQAGQWTPPAASEPEEDEE